jgi:hypothetical protein
MEEERRADQEKTRAIIQRLDQIEEERVVEKVESKEMEATLAANNKKELKAWAGNLLIKVVEKLQREQGIEVEGPGNDPKASQKRLVNAAQAIWDKHGTIQKNKWIEETKEEADERWKKETCLKSKFRHFFDEFADKIDARNVLARETSRDFAKLLLRAQFYEKHEYIY